MDERRRDQRIEIGESRGNQEPEMDSYDLRAGVTPTLLASLPAWATAIVMAIGCGILGNGSARGLWIAATTALIASGWVTINNAARKGKEKERQLYERWDGKPTTRMLRRSNSELEENKKRDLYKIIQGMEIELPTREDEVRRKGWADKQWDLAVAKMRTKTKTDARVQSANRKYGFRRNLYGKRREGWFWWVVSLWMITGWATLTTVCPGTELETRYTTGGIAGVMLTVWAVWWTKENREKWVKEAADGYARQLFDAQL